MKKTSATFLPAQMLRQRLRTRVTGPRVRRRFDRRIDEFIRTGESLPGDGDLLNEAFLVSGGRALSNASSRMQAHQRLYSYSNAEDFLGLWRVPGSLDRALGDLRSQGFALLDTSLPADTVQQLTAFMSSAPCTLTSDKETSLGARETVQVDFSTPLAEKYAITVSALLKNSLIRRMLLDKGLLQVAQEYLGAIPTIDIVTAWYSFPSSLPSHEAAQLFHFDLDRIRWLKVFFLLTDQTIETGAHMYVPGTHRDGGIDKRLLAKGYVRLEDDEVSSFYPRDTWKPMEAPAGSILLEDTRGLHKGISLKTGHRLMMQFEYAQSLFGHVPHLATVDLPVIEDAYWDKMLENYPTLFEALAR